MKTIVRKIDPTAPEPQIVAEAAEIIRSGGLVAFPTETVYGLGANALDAAAVRRIFEAKGRPANNPVIVHVAETGGARRVASEWPDLADKLATRFWPGPLTLVLRKQDCVPADVTAGGPTVAVRVPSNPVALALIQTAGTPIAAPSANRSTEISPTRAEHVLRSLDGRVEMILDGGPTTGGIESTVLALDGGARILRPGLISSAEIELILGSHLTRPNAQQTGQSTILESPGMMERHYAPRATLILVPAGTGAETARGLRTQGKKVGGLFLGSVSEEGNEIAMPASAPGYAARLYHALHLMDAADVDVIVAELPPETDEWLAIRDRLLRATSPS